MRKECTQKTHVFDADGNDTETDFAKMFMIIKESGFSGWVSVEYEGGLIKCIVKMINTWMMMQVCLRQKNSLKK